MLLFYNFTFFLKTSYNTSLVIIYSSNFFHETQLKSTKNIGGVYFSENRTIFSDPLIINFKYFFKSKCNKVITLYIFFPYLLSKGGFISMAKCLKLRERCQLRPRGDVYEKIWEPKFQWLSSSLCSWDKHKQRLPAPLGGFQVNKRGTAFRGWGQASKWATHNLAHSSSLSTELWLNSNIPSRHPLVPNAPF